MSCPLSAAMGVGMTGAGTCWGEVGSRPESVNRQEVIKEKGEDV